MADDELAVFQAELASIDGAGDAPADGSASPEEKRFEDDDGTVYAWDPRTRKFAPEGEDVPAPAAGAGTSSPSGANFLVRGSHAYTCLLYTSPSPRDGLLARMPSSA